MIKGILIAALLAVAGAASAADLSSVGTTSVEAVADYSYARSINTPYWDSAHEGLAGIQLNGGALGSVALEAGDTQRVTDFRLNYTTFLVGYANGLKLGSVNVVAGAAYSDATGDLWFPFSHGQNSSLPINVVAGTAEVNAPLAGPFRVFADYEHTYTWSGNINSFYKDVVKVTSANGNGAAVGTYVNLSKSVVVKVGYSRGWSQVDTQGVLASIAYKF